MFKAYCASMAAALLAGTAGSTAAQTQTSAPTQTQAAKPAYNGNEIVCEKQETTGSRLGAKRVCMTRSEWAERRLQDRQELERVQVHRGNKGE